MADINQQCCGLCSGPITDSTLNFTIIEQSILDSLFQKWDLIDGCTNICSVCSGELYRVSEFKSKYLKSNSTIMKYINSETVLPLDILDIYKKQVENEELFNTLADKKICRLCMKIVKGEFKSLQDKENNKIRTYIPELNFSFTSDPIACRSCFNSLQVLIKLTENCITRQQQQHNESREAICVPNEHCKPEMTEGGEQPTILEKVVVETEEEKSDRLQNITSELLTNPDMPESKPPGFEVTNQQEPLPSTSQYKSAELDLQSQLEGRVTNNLQKDKDVSKMKMYKCDQCDYNAKRKDNLKRHQLIHKNPSEIKMYECKYCDYQSKYKWYVVKHQLKHADQSQVKMYKCTECDYQSKYKGGVVKHQLKHADKSQVKMYRCAKCDYQSKYKHAVVSHQLKHADQSQMKMYKCTECDYQSKYKCAVVRHQLKHADQSQVKMYKCNVCDFHTKYKKSCKKHELRHTQPAH